MRQFYLTFRVLGVLTAAACSDTLVSENTNQPERDRALSQPADVETFIGNAYNTVHRGTIGGQNDALQPGMQVMGLENSSLLSNFDMNVRGGMPRQAVDNSRGNSGLTIHYYNWRILHSAARSAALGMAAIGDGVVFVDTARNARNRAFGYFVMGLGLGNIALAYDSVSVIKWDDPADQYDFPLVGYSAGMDLALAYLDTAIAIANTTPGGFPLPTSFLNGAVGSAAGGGATQADFVRFIRSYKARFRAGVARNPTERAAVDWNAVIADAQNGNQRDYSIAASPTAGWDVVWPIQHYLYQNWHQMWQFIMGMADTSGAYDAWLALPAASKQPFLVQTPDRRFPAGADRATQQTNSPAAPPAGLYFRNRPSGEDVLTSNPLGNSYYDFYRFAAWRNPPASRNGPYPVFTRSELNGLIAEGAIYTSQFALATAYIDSSRVRSGLPSVAGISDLVTPVPGGAACVPRIPVGPNYTSSACGNLLEAMKWEYRMETAYTGFGMWYFAGRGWGDLPEGTPEQHPVPYQELDVRSVPLYNLGGVGKPSGSLRGTYGL
jgi:hypothetical protein